MVLGALPFCLNMRNWDLCGLYTRRTMPVAYLEESIDIKQEYDLGSIGRVKGLGFRVWGLGFRV